MGNTTSLEDARGGQGEELKLPTNKAFPIVLSGIRPLPVLARSVVCRTKMGPKGKGGRGKKFVHFPWGEKGEYIEEI